MPTITISLGELKQLMKKEIADSQIEELLPLNKLEVDEWGEELKLEATPDRPDLFSVEGIARQLRLWLGIQRGLVSYPLAKTRITIKSSDVKSRPYIVSGMIRGINLNDGIIKSIMQLQETLDATLGRGRLKTSIGIHDPRDIRPPLAYREVSPESVSFIPLGMQEEMNLKEILKKHPKGIKYKHILKGKKYPILMDSKKQVLSFPPIINGELTKVREDTTNLFIDITGLDPTPLNYALNILMTSIAERGGRLEAVKINDKITPNLNPRNMRINFDEPRRVLGLGLKNTEISSLLQRMGYGVDKNIVYIPSYRPDILHHVDIVEDIAIAYGFNDIEPEVPRHHSMGRPHGTEEHSNTLREMMIGIGFQEVMNYTLTSDDRHFRKMGLRIPARAVRIANPISSEYSICRLSLLPSLMETLSHNKNRRFPQKVFEISDCILTDPKTDTRTKNVRMLAAVSSHSRAELTDVMSTLNTIKSNLGISWEVKNHSHPSFIPGRCGQIVSGGETIGIFGEVHPKVLVSWGLEKPVACFEINAEFLRLE